MCALVFTDSVGQCHASVCVTETACALSSRCVEERFEHGLRLSRRRGCHRRKGAMDKQASSGRCLAQENRRADATRIAAVRMT